VPDASFESVTVVPVGTSATYVSASIPVPETFIPIVMALVSEIEVTAVVVLSVPFVGPTLALAVNASQTDKAIRVI